MGVAEKALNEQGVSATGSVTVMELQIRNSVKIQDQLFTMTIYKTGTWRWLNKKDNFVQCKGIIKKAFEIWGIPTENYKEA